MKRVFSIFLTVALLFTMLPTGLFGLTASAATYGYYTYSVSGGEATITDVSESISGDATIPSTLGGSPVTSIGGWAFYNCTRLTGITIPDSVTSIGNSAFSDCINLTGITIPDSVTSIGSSVFNSCSSLNSITIPDSVTSIGNSAFYDCSSLTSITIGGGVTSIGSSAFYNTGYYNNSSNWENDVLYIGNRLIEAKTSISGSYTIKAGTITIVGGAFEDCTRLTSITIPDSVTSIGYDAFYNCKNLTGITIPDSVTSIGYRAFYNCYGLTSITIPDSVTSIGSSAFRYCSSLTSITIPDSVTSIGSYAFYECSSLTSITIPDNVTSIGEGVFRGCSKLESITLPFVGSSRTANGTYDAVFGYIFGYTSSSSSGTTLQYYSSSGSYYYYIPSSLKSVTITDATQIPYGAFYNCGGLTSITIGGGVTSIGNSAFYNCTGLKKVFYSGTQAQWNAISVGSSNSSLTNATLQFVTYDDGHCFYEIARTEPTCVVDGVKEEKCSDCGEIRTTIIIPATGNHDYEWVVVIEPTCVARGFKQQECTGCGDVQNMYTVVPATGVHTFEWVTDTEPTCGATGTKHEKCSVCNATQSMGSEIPATGNHIYSDSCDTTCNNCDAIRDITHTFEWVTDTVPTCGATGTKHENCSVCGLVQSENTVIPATGNHTFEWVTDTEPTCGATGTKHENCSVCGLVQSENTVIPATGNHTFEWVTDTEPTCGVEGKKHEECSVCGAIRNANTTIPATGNHTYDWVIMVEPTCVDVGFKQEQCTVCNKIQNAYTPVPATGEHTYNNDHDADCNICGAEREVEPPVGNNVQILGSSMVCVDGTIELIVNLTDCADATSVGVALSHSDCFQLLSTEWLQAGSLKRFDTNTNMGALGGLESANINGNLFKITLKATKEIETAEVSLQVIAKNGTAVVMDATATKEITFGLRGDLNGDNEVSDADAVYLLMHTFFADFYPVNQDCDFNKDGLISDADAVYLLMYTFFPDFYPIA